MTHSQESLPHGLILFVDKLLRQIMTRYFEISLCLQVFFVNPADPKSKDLLKMAEAFYVHNAPVRY